MQKLTIKKGIRFRMAGEPSTDLTALPDARQVAMLPAKIPHIKPRLYVAEGDTVQIGSILFEDKRDPRFKFLSPGGGKIQRIHFGPRRVVEAIVIDRQSTDEPQVQFPVIDDKTLETMDRGQLVARILEGGLWWAFRQLPFRDLPDPDSTPPLILVGLDAKEPFQPAPAVYLKDQAELLAFGLKVLRKLTRGQVVVFTGDEHHGRIDPDRNQLTHAVTGHYPSDDPGTVLYHIKTSAAENRAWYIAGQDLLMLAQLLTQGCCPIHRVVAVAGSAASVRQHYRVRLGAPLAQLTAPQAPKDPVRLVVGGLFRGYDAAPEGFMGLYETALNIVPAGGRAEFLALFNPGAGRHSYSRTFASKLNPAKLVYDCNLHGDRRACIACMHCADVCPVEMLPQMVLKAILAEEVEEYLELGLLDCVECGLCSYVCPSKIELSQTFIATKATYAREQGRKSE
jgi:Na+-transporting NADH:ubiquinone oxidoreductase subunit A